MKDSAQAFSAVGVLKSSENRSRDGATTQNPEFPLFWDKHPSLRAPRTQIVAVLPAKTAAAITKEIYATVTYFVVTVDQIGHGEEPHELF